MKSKNILFNKRFLKRLSRSLLISLLIILFGLMIGMWGYHHFERMRWVDAFVNAAMILSGMGPVNPLFTNAGKIFAGLYAIFSGLAIIIIIGVIIAPVIHHFLRRFRMEDD